MKHDDLMHALAANLRGNSDRMIWTDMQLGPAGSPRPDVYAIMKSYTSPLPTAYECKVSVADFRGDVTSGKWQEYLRFAGAVIFVTPKGLVQKGDVPDGCGLMWFYEESGAFRSIKGPTRRPVVIPQDALLKLLIDGVQRAQAPIRNAWMREHEVMKAVREKVGEDVTQFISNKKNALAALEHVNYQVGVKEARLKNIEKILQEKEAEAYRRGTERAEQMRKETDQEWKHLEDVLGMPGANRWDIHRAINNIRTELKTAPEVQRLMHAINSIGKIINREASHPAGTVESVKEVTA